MDVINEYLTQNNLHLNTDSVKKKFLCRICGKILCKPKAGRCGCRYCSSCLSATINENNQCPSCRMHLNFETDVALDIPTENKIMQIEIICPKLFCNENFAINQLNTHLQTCDKKGTKCLFHVYGCSVFVSSDADMHDHLSHNLRYHFNLLLNKISENDDRKDEKIDRIDREIVEYTNEINRKVNEMDRDIDETKNKVEQEKLGSNNKITKRHRDFEQYKESMDAKILKCESKMKLDKLRADIKTEPKLELEKLRAEMKMEADTKLEKLKGEMNKIIEEKSAENSKLREKLNENTKVAEVGEYILVGDGQYKVTFGDMKQKIKNKFYFSEIFTLNHLNFKMRMRYITECNIEFAVCIVKGNNSQSKLPFVNKLTLALLQNDGRVFINHKFSYATSPEDFKFGYNGDWYLPDSRIAVWDNHIMNTNEVSVILMMEEYIMTKVQYTL